MSLVKQQCVWPRIDTFINKKVTFCRHCIRSKARSDRGELVNITSNIPREITGVNQKVLPVLSTETLLHIWLSTEYYGFRPSSTAVDTVS